MRNRILTIALALSLLATVFVALPTKAAYDYTGSVATTNDTGDPKYVYIQGEQVYVKVEVRYHGDLSDEAIRVELRPAGYTWATSAFNAVADLPVDGWYNSSAGGNTLGTGGFWIFEERVCYVIAYERWTMTELGRTTILVRQAGFVVDPEPIFIAGYGTVGYYPGQMLDITMVTTRTTEMFYVQIVNETGTTVQNWTAQIAPTGGWHATWTIPATLANGQYTIRVRDSTTHALWPAPYRYTFDVRAYVFEAFAERDSYLPGETAEIQVVTIDLATLGPATGVTVTYSAHWYNASDGDQWLNGTLLSSMGTHEFAIPASDVATWEWIDITYWANQSTRSESAVVWLDFALLRASISTNSGGYRAGDVVAVTVSATIDGAPLSGCTVGIKVTKNNSEIVAYGVSGLMTDEDGSITHAFKLSSGAAIGMYTVEATVSKLGASTIAATNFEVYEFGNFWVMFDKDYYISGDTIAMTFEANWNGAQVSIGTILVTVVTDWGLLMIGNTSTMSATVTLPTDYVGDVDVYATGYYGDVVMTTSGWTEVFAVDIFVVVDKDTYMPGDKLTFTWNVVGPVAAGTLNYEIWGGNLLIEEASPTFAKTGSVTVDVPKTDPQWYYGMWISLLTPTGTYAESWTDAEIADDGELRVWVEKSKYADGSFKPGQTVKIHYEIFCFWNDPLPLYALVMSCDYDPAEQAVLVTEAKGVVEYKLPADMPSGMVEIEVELWDPVADDLLSRDVTSLVVNNQLSAWDRSIGGMSAIDFLILVLLIVMIIVLIVMPFVKGRQPKAVEEPAPPAEPPKA